jgi:hypothetical protein
MKKFTILIAALALVCFSVPAMAVDWNFYGNARMATFYESRDFGDGLNSAGTDDADAETQWDLQGNSRIGATIKAENINARFEFGVSESNVASRRIYGVWNFGAGKMKVGKDYTPVSQFVSGQVYDADLGLLGIGAFYGSRFGQVAFTFGGFDIALVASSTGFVRGLETKETTTITTPGLQPGQPDVITNVEVADETNGDVDDILPKLEASWGMGFDSWNFKLMGGAQYYSIEDVEPLDGGGTEDLDVTSWVLGGDVGFNFGPGYVKGAVSYGQNIGDAGWSIPGGVNARSGTYQGGKAMWDGDDDVNNTYTLQGAIVGGLKVSDMLSFEGGFGYRKDQTDSGTDRDTAPWAAYVQSVIALAPGVYIIPEVGYYDLDNNAAGEEAGSLFYIGGKWQINF